MLITNAEIFEIEIPLRTSFKHALASHNTVQSVILRIDCEGGMTGYGECVPRAYVTGESVASVCGYLKEHALPQVIGRDFPTFSEVIAHLEQAILELDRSANAAHCAFELAMLDLSGKFFAVSAGSVIGPVLNQEVTYSAVVSAEKPAVVRALCTQFAGFKVSSIKMKVGNDESSDRENLKIAREILGENCVIRIDANTAWDSHEALDRLEKMAPYRIAAVEQPLPAADIAGLAWLTQRSPIPIILDESLASFADAQRLADAGACNCFNIRISKCGGLLNSVRIRNYAQKMGIGVMMGAQVGETVLLSAAGRHFATRSADIQYLEGSYGHFLLERDIGLEDLTIGYKGRAPAISGTGLGVGISVEAIQSLSLAKHDYAAIVC